MCFCILNQKLFLHHVEIVYRGDRIDRPTHRSFLLTYIKQRKETVENLVIQSCANERNSPLSSCSKDSHRSVFLYTC